LKKTKNIVIIEQNELNFKQADVKVSERDFFYKKGLTRPHQLGNIRPR